jgi:hypothetical protein
MAISTDVRPKVKADSFSLFQEQLDLLWTKLDLNFCWQTEPPAKA